MTESSSLRHPFLGKKCRDWKHFNGTA